MPPQLPRQTQRSAAAARFLAAGRGVTRPGHKTTAQDNGADAGGAEGSFRSYVSSRSSQRFGRRLSKSLLALRQDWGGDKLR